MLTLLSSFLGRERPVATHREMLSLADLDDHLLRDIGLRRIELHAVPVQRLLPACCSKAARRWAEFVDPPPQRPRFRTRPLLPILTKESSHDFARTPPHCRHRSRPGRPCRRRPPDPARPAREGLRGRRDGRRQRRDWGHVRLFSPWEYNTDTAARALLQAHGWQEPPGKAMPTGSDLYEAYLKPLAETPEMAAVIETGAKVKAITRQGADKVLSRGREAKPFVLAVSNGNGAIRRDLARAVIDASGTWTAPNPLGAGGILAEGEAENAGHIAYGIPDVLGRDRAAYEGKTILVVGAGHSAANVLLDLARLAERDPADVHRVGDPRREPDAGLRRRTGRPAPGPRRTRLQPQGARRQRARHPGGRVLRRPASGRPASRSIVVGETAGGIRELGPVDRIVVATGQRPDLNLTRELRLDLDPWLESSEGARPADRPEPALLRIGAAARPPRARPSGARLLHGRDQELWPRADLPDADGLRAGALGRGGHRRRHGGSGRHPSRPAGDGRVLDQRRARGAGIVRMLRRACPGRGRRLLRRGRRGQGRGPVRLRMRSREDAGEGCGTCGLLLRSVRVESGE